MFMNIFFIDHTQGSRSTRSWTSTRLSWDSSPWVLSWNGRDRALNSWIAPWV